MKGITFEKPYELTLETQGEKWHQGQDLKGILLVKSHGDPSLLDKTQFRVTLAYGELAGVRAKSQDAFTTVSTQEFKGGAEFNWEFKLQKSSPITDAKGSLFLLFDAGPGSQKQGALQILVEPTPLILEAARTLEADFYFKTKAKKFVKGQVEIKLDPPSSKSYATVDLLLLTAEEKDDALELKYVFQVKKIDTTPGSRVILKDKREFKKTLSLKNPDFVKNHEEVLNQVASKFY